MKSDRSATHFSRLLPSFSQARGFLPNCPAAVRTWLLLILLACRWSTACAQVTYYTDEGTFNAATATLQSITETYEGLAPTGGETDNPTLPSGYVIDPPSVYNPIYNAGGPGFAADAAYVSGYLSLNETASYVQPTDGVNDLEVIIFAPAGQMTAFCTDLGSLSKYGGDLSAGGDANAPGNYATYPYPLTDTVEVSLYSGDGKGGPSAQVGQTFYAGVVANGFVGAVSTQPFQFAIIVKRTKGYGTLSDGNGYPLGNPYNIVLDNTRFGAASTLPMVIARGSSPDADVVTGQAGAFLLTLSSKAATTLTVSYTIGGSAVSGTDYQPLSGSVQIPAGQTTALVPVAPVAGTTIGRAVALTLQPGTGYLVGTPGPVQVNLAPLPFFTGETTLTNGVYYLQLPDGNPFGYYSYLSDPHYLYHFDLGYEYCFDAGDGKSGVYFYDFASKTFFYTSPTFPFPYLYDFTLNTVLYYYPDPNNAGHYNTNGVRYFYDFATGQIITK